MAHNQKKCLCFTLKFASIHFPFFEPSRHLFTSREKGKAVVVVYCCVCYTTKIMKKRPRMAHIYKKCVKHQHLIFSFSRTFYILIFSVTFCHTVSLEQGRPLLSIMAACAFHFKAFIVFA